MAAAELVTHLMGDIVDVEGVADRRARTGDTLRLAAGAADRAECGHTAAAGADLFLSGEVSERTTHLARELGVAYVAAGHHATERYGVQALAGDVAERFGLEQRYVDIDNPA